MHEIEPFYNWRHLYEAENDEQSPFFGREYSEFDFTNTVYNYFIHPQWDEIGSTTLYVKNIFVDYDVNFAIIEFMGEWNDAVHDDFMILKRNVLDHLYEKGIYKYVFILENVLNFHSGDDDYYEEWLSELNEEHGWAVIVNIPEQTYYDFKEGRIYRFFRFIEMPNWRTFQPQFIYEKLDNLRLKSGDA